MEMKTSAHRFREELDFVWKIATFLLRPSWMQQTTMTTTTHCTFCVRPSGRFYRTHFSLLHISHFSFVWSANFFCFFFLSRQLKHYFISNLWVINCPFIIDLSPLMLISLLMHRTLQPIGFKFLISLSHSRYISAHPSPLKFHATFGT